MQIDAGRNAYCIRRKAQSVARPVLRSAAIARPLSKQTGRHSVLELPNVAPVIADSREAISHSEPTQPQQTRSNGPCDALRHSADRSQDRGDGATDPAVDLGTSAPPTDTAVTDLPRSFLPEELRLGLRFIDWIMQLLVRIREARLETLRPRRARLGGIGTGVGDGQSKNLSSICATWLSRYARINSARASESESNGCR